MAADVAQTKLRRHVSHTCTFACVCECVSVHVCARVCMNNEIAPFRGFSLSRYEYTTYILTHSPDFLSCETIFLFSYAQVTWCRMESLIHALNENCQFSLKSGGLWYTLVSQRIVLK